MHFWHARSFWKGTSPNPTCSASRFLGVYKDIHSNHTQNPKHYIDVILESEQKKIHATQEALESSE